MASSENLYPFIVDQYIALSSATWSFVEAIATLPDEIALVWPTTWSPMKFVFLANKYMVLGDAVLQVIGYTGFMFVSDFYSYWFLTGTIFGEVILVARTLALWGFNKYLTGFVILTGLQLIPEAYYVLYDWISYLRSTSRPSMVACFSGVDSRNVWPAFLAFSGVEAFVIICTFIKQFQPYDRECRISSHNRLFQTLYHDGTMFWVITLIFSIANFAVMFLAPVELSDCMTPPLRAVHSALCTRVLLNLRKAAANQCPSDPDFTLATTLAFDRALESDAGSEHELEAMSAHGRRETGGDEELGGERIDHGEWVTCDGDFPASDGGSQGSAATDIDG